MSVSLPRQVFAIVSIFAFAGSLVANACADPLASALAPVGFLVGTWSSGEGRVAETDGTSHGTSSIVSEVGGNVLLRRDHVELFGTDGKPSGNFDIIMMIYPEGGTLHADFSDGQHVIHYTSALVTPGSAVMFETSTSPNAPSYHLTYTLTDPQTLSVKFEFAAPGQTTFRPIATGTLHKAS